MVLQDLTHCIGNRRCGAEGIPVEQVLRAAIIKQTEGFSYEELLFHLQGYQEHPSYQEIWMRKERAGLSK